MREERNSHSKNRSEEREKIARLFFDDTGNKNVYQKRKKKRQNEWIQRRERDKETKIGKNIHV